MNKSTGISYNPHIDGLRAIAVLAVIFFHLEVPYFRGGFVGVDIFFVISGFLISRLILVDMNNGSFSFSNFYLRRMRRILPALLFTLAITFILGYFIFSPSLFGRLSGSTLYASFSVSNFFFWQEAGYFDTSSDLKPLLHTWSLSIEEPWQAPSPDYL